MKFQWTAVLVAGIGVVALAVIWGNRSDVGGTEPSDTVPRTERVSDETVGARAEVVTPGDRAVAERIAPIEDDAPLRENFDLEAAGHFDGHIALPPGCPEDESIEILLVERFEGDRATLFAGEDGHRARIDDVIDRLAARDGALAWVRRDVGGDGSFTLPYPDGIEAAFLFVEARWVLLGQTPWIDFTRGVPDPLVLEPDLGGRIVASVVPSLSDPEGLARFVDVPFEVLTWADNAASFHAATRRTGPNLEVEFGPLFANELHEVSTADDLAFFDSVDDVMVRAGEQTPVTLHLQCGAQIFGRVVDADGDEVAGALCAWSANVRETDGVVEVIDASGAFIRCDASGRFELSWVAPGDSVYVEAWAPGIGFGLTTVEEVADGGTHRDVVVVLDYGVRARGTVKWHSGQPVSGARVSARAFTTWTHEGTGFQSNLSNAEFEATTDSDGQFELLVPQCLLEFDAAAVVDPGPPVVEATLSSRQRTHRADEEIELILTAPGTVTGQVLDDRSQPVLEFTIAVRDQTKFPIPQDAKSKHTFRSNDGRYEVGGVPASANVSVEAIGHSGTGSDVRFGAGQSFVQVRDFTVTRQAYVTGTVRKPGGALVSDAVVLVTSSFGHTVDRTWTDSSGRFGLYCAPDTEFALRADADGWLEGDPVRIEALSPGGRLEDIELVVHRGARLTGSALDGDGRPWGNCKIHCYGTTTDAKRTTVADASGAFAFDAMEPDTYMVAALPNVDNAQDPDPDPSVLASVRTSMVVVEAEDVHVVVGGHEPDAVVVLGQVTHGGEPVAGAMITTAPVGGNEPAVATNMRMALTDEDGRFELTLAAPGATLVQLNRLTTESLSGNEQSHSWSIEVPAGPTFELELELPTARIEGRVVSPDGEGARSVRVQLTPIDDAPPGAVPRSTVTDHLGRFSFDFVEPGGRTLRAAGSRGGFAMTEVVVGRSVEPSPTELRLGPTGGIRCTVRDAAGSAVAGATIQVRSADGHIVNFPLEDSTDEAGTVESTSIPIGEVTVTATLGTSNPSKAAELTVFVDAWTDVQLVL